MVSPVFSGLTIHLAPDVPAAVALHIQRRGGRVTKQPIGDVNDVWCSVWRSVPQSGAAAATSTEVPALLRSLRVPVVSDLWVLCCAQAEELLPLKGGPAVILYDPFMFDGVRFTTTQLPQHIKRNVVAAMIFFGGHYSPVLTTDTNVVVYASLVVPSTKTESGGLAGSKKFRIAQARGIPCVRPGWVQKCLHAGRQLPLPSQTVRSFIPHPCFSLSASEPSAVESASPKASPSPSPSAPESPQTVSDLVQHFSLLPPASMRSMLSFLRRSPPRTVNGAVCFKRTRGTSMEPMLPTRLSPAPITSEA